MASTVIQDPAPEPYFRPSQLGPDCSTERNARLRERRVRLGYARLSEPLEYARLAAAAKRIYLEHEPTDPALARARALVHVVEHSPVTLEPDTLFLGGENPFFFNLLLPALQGDRYARERARYLGESARALQQAGVFSGPCFEGHITPGIEYIIPQGIAGFRRRVEEEYHAFMLRRTADPAREHFYEAAFLCCDALDRYAARYREQALLAAETAEPGHAAELREAAAVLERVPHGPARTLREALQSYWLAYILVTLEMGGCCPGGGIGLGRIDQFLYPYYQRDITADRLTRAGALELIEQFLLCFCHIDYFTGHQQYTPGSQTSLGGILPNGQDAFNELSELILEASLRINMPAPYVSLRLYRGAPERYWRAAANYIASGLGFPVVNDEVLIPAMLRHGRSLGDARDYICSCCYEHTIPGREAFHPSGVFVNLPLLLEMALNQGSTVLKDQQVGAACRPALSFATFEQLYAAFETQVRHALAEITAAVNRADEAHCALRRYPLMSLFIDDCLAKGQDVCAGGARYNLFGCVAAGLPNLVNSLAAIRKVVYESQALPLAEVLAALKANFVGYEAVQRQLQAAPKWGNDIPAVDELAGRVANLLYDALSPVRNARGGRWQLALYSFIANTWMGQAAGASADGRPAGEILTRNLNPTWGSDRKGPTAVLNSLSHIDFSTSPDGSSLDLRFDPAAFATPELRRTFVDFLKAFVELGVMEMQVTVVDTATLLDARAHPERYPHLLVRVAGYSARFVDLPRQEQDEIIGRSQQTF
ncbi:MAG: pyruvate formate lyase family protein [Anaerolineae bacterium]